MRSGPPWASGIGSPFSSQASSTVSRVESGTERSTITSLGLSPAGRSSPPVPVTNCAPCTGPPRASTTARSGTPVQITQPAAPTVQGVPEIFWPGWSASCMYFRPLPEHCSTVATLARPIRFSSASVSVRGCVTPAISTRHASRSATMASEGGLTLLRMNRRSVGVTIPLPIQARLVSSV
ncbi:hypothetical protein BK022_00960 [Methylorubrum extorquens]|uniref:Uncharacterized protein n=1 Tax=Methylorubrum extorquens TaxID=408 RepID=A0A1S1PAP1_METEX|nr:hypothetical protein BK022_00960 [Methylorubrum extorquens]